MSGVALYDLGTGRDILSEWLEESEGEVTPTLEALLAEWDAKWDWKAERVALFILEQQRNADAAKYEADRLRAIAKHRENAAASLKLYLQREMERVGKTKVAGHLATIAIQLNNPAVKGELTPDELAAIHANGPAIVKHIPESFVLDRTAVLAVHKAGGELPAGLSVERSSSIRIR